MNKIVIYNITPDCEKEIEFVCSQESKIFISEISSGINVPIGRHKIKIKRHHDFFLDWYINDQLIEEFLVWQVISDEDSILSIKSSENVYFDNENESQEGKIINEIFPFLMKLNGDNIRFSIQCLVPSQLSIFFVDKQHNLDFKTLTLAFSENYCKVFLDTYQGGKYQENLRENLSLFNYKKEKNTEFTIDKLSNNINVKNDSIESKNYDLINSIPENCEEILINESYAPNGPGIYKIKKL